MYTNKPFFTLGYTFLKPFFTLGYTFLLMLFFLSPKYINAQSKVQKFYESENYGKCINLSNKNLSKGRDILNSSLYKSLSIIELYNNKKLNEQYSNPISQALNGIKTIEKYSAKHPSDYFHSENRYRIDKVVRFAENEADSFYIQGKIKEAKKILIKLRKIFPENNLYLYKFAKLYNFNSYAVLKSDKNISEKELHKKLYEVIKNSEKYFKSGEKSEFLNDLNLLYSDTACDLETASTILVLYPQKFKQDAEFEKQAIRFQKKYYQIKMLFEINSTRAAGYACGSLLTDPRPPLILDNCLCRTAKKYAAYMQKENFFSHTGNDGSSPWNRAEREGCSANAENLAENSTKNTKTVLQQWLNSEGHCKNIMGFHQKIGIGNSGSYWVQMFR
ncbi:MAG: CAP domain-containing protein [Chlorobi bacterium]|nr:CAP domain-containing protein [Chlorobiota bacterium]